MTDADRFSFLVTVGRLGVSEDSDKPGAVFRARVDFFEGAKGCAVFVSVPGVGERYGAGETMGQAVDRLAASLADRPLGSGRRAGKG